LKQGQSRVLTDTPEKNDVETLQSKNKWSLKREK
jgi:hypothetical protein